MQKIYFLFIIVFLLVFGGCTATQPKRSRLAGPNDKKFITNQIISLVNNTDPHINLGLKITSLDNKIIYQKNIYNKFIPASTIKLFTLAAGLYYLGPSYRFQTKIYTDQVSKKATDVKNLYIQGSGDPSLQDHNLIKLAYELKQMGIKKITGDIFIDDTIFDNILWGSGTMWKDRTYGYSAPVTGLNLNYNRILIKTKPALITQLPAYSIISPPTKFIKIRSEAQTKKSNKLRILNIQIEKKHADKNKWPTENHEGLSQGDTIFVSGQAPINTAPSYSLLAVKNPSLLAGVFFSEQLKNLGIKFTGQIKRQKIPDNPILLATHQSRPLSRALIDFVKISNNVAMEAIVKTIAHHDNPTKPASARAGMRLINNFLHDQVKINTKNLITTDGSGLSRYNLVTPEQINKLLLYAANEFNFGPEFMSSLPIAGQDGNLGGRFKNPYLGRKIRAKGGTLSGISNLAGYFLGENNQRYSFVIMINNFVGSARKFQKLQEDILATMLIPIDTQLAETPKIN